MAANTEMFKGFVCIADGFHSGALAFLSSSLCIRLSLFAFPLSPPLSFPFSLSLVPWGAQLGEADKHMGARGLASTLLPQCHALLFKGPSQKWEGLNPSWKSQAGEAAVGVRIYTSRETGREWCLSGAVFDNYDGAFTLSLPWSLVFSTVCLPRNAHTLLSKYNICQHFEVHMIKQHMYIS